MNKGDKFNFTFTVSKQVYKGFLIIFNDNNPLHTDESYAKKKGFSGIVMHGNILNGFLSYFIGECLPERNLILHTQEIKYFYPVYLNETLNFFAEVADVFDSVKTLEFKFFFQNSLGKKVAKGKFQVGII